jgi:predicted acetyltransferase
MILQIPSLKHKEMYNELIINWSDAEEIPTSPSRLFYWNNFEVFLKEVTKDFTNSSTWINSSLFFLINNNEIVWAIQIRHSIDHPNLIETWWHIWYWVTPKYRKKLYASKILKLWLIEAKKILLKNILITCDIDNIASKKVIEKNWWIFERLTKDWKMNRYFITL